MISTIVMPIIRVPGQENQWLLLLHLVRAVSLFVQTLVFANTGAAIERQRFNDMAKMDMPRTTARCIGAEQKRVKIWTLLSGNFVIKLPDHQHCETHVYCTARCSWRTARRSYTAQQGACVSRREMLVVYSEMLIHCAAKCLRIMLRDACDVRRDASTYIGL